MLPLAASWRRRRRAIHYSREAEGSKVRVTRGSESKEEEEERLLFLLLNKHEHLAHCLLIMNLDSFARSLARRWRRPDDQPKLATLFPGQSRCASCQAFLQFQFQFHFQPSGSSQMAPLTPPPSNSNGSRSHCAFQVSGCVCLQQCNK